MMKVANLSESEKCFLNYSLRLKLDTVSTQQTLCNGVVETEKKE